MPTPLSDTAAGGLQRVFAYARVSTVEQLTENQREQIARAGYDIAPKRFIEEQISGSVPAAQRPGFQRLLERMDEGDTLGDQARPHWQGFHRRAADRRTVPK